MRLQRARVRNYRSIVDSGIVDIEDRVTVIIGKNEQGKTSFQRGLASLNDGANYRAIDLPKHLRAELENAPADKLAIVDGWFTFDRADLERLKKALPETYAVTGLRVTRYYDGHYSYAAITESGQEMDLEARPANIVQPVKEIQGDAEALREKLKAHAERLPAFAPSIEAANSHIDALVGSRFRNYDNIANNLKTFSTAMKAVPNQDAAIQEDISNTLAAMGRVQTAIQQAMTQDFYAPIRAALPHFIFHHTITDKIPDFVGITDFIANPDATSKGMANLCAVAGLSMEKLQLLANTMDAPERETFEDHYRAAISGGINEFWTQERYTVHFRLEPSRLSVSISDGSYSSRIQPSDRSDGFQWYLSFYAALLSEVSDEGPLVLLLDNPGLELHSDGQRDIKRFLEEKLPLSVQVIYVTHSPAMIDAFRLEQVRQVELLGDLQGTKVGKLAIKEGTEFDLLEPVRSAIGASLASSLIAHELNVLVEGAADKPILDAAFGLLPADNGRRIMVNGSIAENNGLLPRFYDRGNLPFVVFLDADSAGRGLKSRLASWGIPESKIVELATVFDAITGRDFDLEDVLSIGFYHRAVLAAYPESRVVAPSPDEPGKRTKYYETKFREERGPGFSKRRVAEAANRLWREGKGDAETAESLRKIAEAIWTSLEAQIRPAAAR